MVEDLNEEKLILKYPFLPVDEMGCISSSMMHSPTYLESFDDGSMLLSDAANNCIRYINSSHTKIETVSDKIWSDPCGIVALSTSISKYVAIVCDSKHHQLRRITSSVDSYHQHSSVSPTSSSYDQWSMNIFAGTGEASLHNGDWDVSTFNTPTDVAMLSSGELVVADSGNHAIRLITLDTDGATAQKITTIAGGKAPGYSDGVGLVAKFCNPTSICVDQHDRVLITDTGNNCIRIMIPTRTKSSNSKRKDILSPNKIFHRRWRVITVVPPSLSLQAPCGITNISLSPSTSHFLSAGAVKNTATSRLTTSSSTNEEDYGRRPSSSNKSPKRSSVNRNKILKDIIVISDTYNNSLCFLSQTPIYHETNKNEQGDKEFVEVDIEDDSDASCSSCSTCLIPYREDNQLGVTDYTTTTRTVEGSVRRSSVHSTCSNHNAKSPKSPINKFPSDEVIVALKDYLYLSRIENPLCRHIYKSTPSRSSRSLRRKTGSYYTSIKRLATSPVVFKLPQGVSYNRATRSLYVADTGNNVVKILKLDRNCSLLGRHPSSPRNTHSSTAGHTTTSSSSMIDNHNNDKIFSSSGKIINSSKNTSFKAQKITKSRPITATMTSYHHHVSSKNKNSNNKKIKMPQQESPSNYYTSNQYSREALLSQIKAAGKFRVENLNDLNSKFISNRRSREQNKDESIMAENIMLRSEVVRLRYLLGTASNRIEILLNALLSVQQEDETRGNGLSKLIAKR